MVKKFTENSLTKAIIEGSIQAKDFVFEFSNTIGQMLRVEYDEKANRYIVDRSKSGKIDFFKDFNHPIYAPRIADGCAVKFTMVLDVSSIELFFDDGLSVMTGLFFPDQEFSRFKIHS